MSIKAEFLRQAAPLFVIVDTLPCQKRLHEESNWEIIVSLERQKLNGILEPLDVDIVAIVAQVAIHNALEDKAHPLLELPRIGAKYGKVEVKMVFLQ